MTSLRQAINDKCKECIYDSRAEGTWRQQVKNCTSPGCKLYEVRPMPHSVNNEVNLKEKSSELVQKEEQLALSLNSSDTDETRQEIALFEGVNK